MGFDSSSAISVVAQLEKIEEKRWDSLREEAHSPVTVKLPEQLGNFTLVKIRNLKKLPTTIREADQCAVKMRNTLSECFYDKARKGALQEFLREATGDHLHSKFVLGIKIYGSSDALEAVAILTYDFKNAKFTADRISIEKFQHEAPPELKHLITCHT